MHVSELRAQFPVTRSTAYLGAAAASPLSLPVVAAAEAHLRETLERGDVGFPRWLAEKEALRGRVARLIGAPARQVGFVGSTGFGFTAIAELFWRRGIREVLTLEGEFPSTTVAFLNRGLSLNVVRARPDGSYPVEDIEAALRNSTGAIAVSAVQFASGCRVDLTALSELCRATKLPLAINGAQALGQIAIDVEAIGADFFCAPSHKWVMGGYGVGLFYAREGWLEESGLPWATWFSAPDEGRWNAFYGSQKADTAHGFIAAGLTTMRVPAALEHQIGWPAMFSVSAAIGLIEQVGVPVIERHNGALQRLVREGLRARGFVPNAPDDQCSGICVVPVSGPPLEVVRALIGEGVVTTPRGVGVRVATHVFNDAGDVERLLAAVDRLAIRPA